MVRLSTMGGVDPVDRILEAARGLDVLHKQAGIVSKQQMMRYGRQAPSNSMGQTWLQLKCSRPPTTLLGPAGQQAYVPQLAHGCTAVHVLQHKHSVAVHQQSESEDSHLDVPQQVVQPVLRLGVAPVTPDAPVGCCNLVLGPLPHREAAEQHEACPIDHLIPEGHQLAAQGRQNKVLLDHVLQASRWHDDRVMERGGTLVQSQGPVTAQAKYHKQRALQIPVFSPHMTCMNMQSYSSAGGGQRGG